MRERARATCVWRDKVESVLKMTHTNVIGASIAIHTQSPRPVFTFAYRYGRLYVSPFHKKTFMQDLVYSAMAPFLFVWHFV